MLNAAVLDNTGAGRLGLGELTVGYVLNKAEEFCSQKLKDDEAVSMLDLTRERFVEVRDELDRHSDSYGEIVFKNALARFWKKLCAHSAMSLASRVVDYKYLIQILDAIHNGVDGLDGVYRRVIVQWKKRAAFMAAQKVYASVLHRAMGTTVATWKANVVAHKIAIEHADRVLQQARQSKDRMQWAENGLARLLGSDVSNLAKEALNHVLNSANPPWFIQDAHCGIEFARGSFGTVHFGKLGAHGDIGGAEVVIKRRRPNADGVITETMRAEFVKEVNLWTQLKHPYVLQIFGANHTAKLPFMVCECAATENLSGYLQSAAGKKRFWRMLYQVAIGIGYLHDNNTIHGDLKLDNFVMGKDNYARVTDFSLTRVKLSSDRHATVPSRGTQAAGALRWRAPECVGVDNVAPQLASDVYSFALCIFEAFEGTPYGYLPDDASVTEQIKLARLPERGDIPNDAWRLITDIAQKDPRGRPTIQDVVRRLWEFVEIEVGKENVQQEDKHHLVCAQCRTKTPFTGRKYCVSCENTPHEKKFKIQSKADLPRAMELLNSQSNSQKLNATEALQNYISQGMAQENEVINARAISVLSKIANDAVEKHDVRRDARNTLAAFGKQSVPNRKNNDIDGRQSNSRAGTREDNRRWHGHKSLRSKLAELAVNAAVKAFQGTSSSSDDSDDSDSDSDDSDDSDGDDVEYSITFSF